MFFTKLRIHFFCYFVLLTGKSTSHDVAPSCSLHKTEKALECSQIYNFPNAPSKDIETILFWNNTLIELNPSVFSNNGFHNLKEIILQYSGITVISTNAFSDVSGVVKLDLYGNHITELKKHNFNKLPYLEKLFLGNNQIRQIQAEAIQELKSLEILDLSKNFVTKLPVNLLTHIFVKELDLSENLITLAEHGSILDSPSLSTLSLRACGIEKFPSGAFNSLKKIQVLDLSKNKLTMISRDLLKPLVDLEYLDISRNLIRHMEFSVLLSLRNFWHISCEGNLLFSRNCELFTDDTTNNLAETVANPTANQGNENGNGNRIVLIIALAIILFFLLVKTDIKEIIWQRIRKSWFNKGARVMTTQKMEDNSSDKSLS